MHEIELKFGLPASQLDALRAELARLGADIARPQILQAAYFDTPDRRLAQARAALRVRGVGMVAYPHGQIRAVTHRGIDDARNVASIIKVMLG